MIDIVERLREGNGADWQTADEAADTITALRGEVERLADKSAQHSLEVARLREALEWRPIETAPRDGTLIQIRKGGFIITALWRDIYACKWVMPSEKGWIEIDWIKPTHWLPIPPPPAVEEGEDEPA